jgi:trans-aconitate methyltransferase
MTVDDAADLIRCPAVDGVMATWCELGAGTGTFTRALATLLAPGSRILAVDRDATALAALPSRHRGVSIEAETGDFTADLTLPVVDGVLMANALHFVRDQAAFLARLRDVSAQVIVVEYAGRRPNPWVPYPVDLAQFGDQARQAGFPVVTQIAARPSAFGGRLYAALATARQS